MILRNFKFFIGCCILLLATSCDAILFEEDLSDENVVLLAPLNGSEVNSGAVVFSWEPLEDATNYQLQIASPSFENANQILLDTLIPKRNFSKELLVNNYEWRLKALNSAYETAFVTNNFSVMESTEFANGLVGLTSPKDAFSSNIISQDLAWSTYTGASDYRLQIWSPDTSGTLLSDETLADTNKTYVFEEGSYTWQVRGQNSTQNTLYNSRTLIIDTTAPNLATQNTPANNATITDTTVSFTWSRTPLVGSEETDSLYVYTDVELMQLSFKTIGNDSAFEATMEKGDYYWFLQSFDAAGNSNTKTGIFNFNID